MSAIYILHLYTKEKLIQRKKVPFLILAYLQVSMGYQLVVKKIFELDLYENPFYMLALALYLLTQVLLIVACYGTRNGA